MWNTIKNNWQLCLAGLLGIGLIFAIGIAGYYYQKAKFPAQVVSAKQIIMRDNRAGDRYVYR